MIFTCLMLLLGGALAYDSSLYAGHKLLHVYPETTVQVTSLLDLVDFMTSGTHMQTPIQVWNEPRPGAASDLLVSPSRFDAFVRNLDAKNIRYEVDAKNIEAEMEAEWQRLVSSGRIDSQVYDPADFNTFVDIMGEVERLAGTCAAQGLSCSTSDYGFSVEGDVLKAITVSSGTPSVGTMSVDSNIHAREWLAVATTMNILDRLIAQSDAEAIELMDKFDWVFVPIMNPDGYQYTFSDDRLWRKNRGNNGGSVCVGTDLNRNYDSNWSGPGASGNPCSDTYHGDSAASEPETAATQPFLVAQGVNTQSAYVSYHTYGYYLLSPYGDCTVPINNADIRQVTDATCAAIEATHGTNWDCGNSCAVLYETSGGSVDFAYDSANFQYSYTPELRGNGFVVPPSEIPDSVSEMWNGMVAMCREIEVIGA